MTINIWTKYKTTLFGLLGSLGFALLCVLLYLFDKGELILLLLYIPGTIFGLAMAVALDRYSDNFGGLFILATIEYLAMVFFCSVIVYFFAALDPLVAPIPAAECTTRCRVSANSPSR